MATLPSQEILNVLLSYDEESGKLYFKPRTVEFFTGERHSPAHSCKKWNSRWAGKEALTKINIGYRCGRLLYQYVLAHRVIWKMMTGEDAIEIDHIDGNRSNNKWSNLKNGTSQENHQNTAKRSDNTSGCVGVTWHSRQKKWQAGITIKGKFVFLGFSDDINEAIAARKAAEVTYNFHKNHGRKAMKLIVS